MTMKFIKDHDAEQILREEGFAVVDQAVSMSKIDAAKSAQINARPEFLDAGRVDRLVMCIQQHRPFKKVVLLKKGNGYLVLGGNHRVAAFVKCEITDIDAYIVECSDEVQITVLAQRLNLHHGKGTTADEAMSQAVDAVIRLGMSAKDVVAKYTVPEGTLKVHVHAHEMRKQAAAWNIKIEGNPVSVLEKMYQYRNREPVLRALMTAIKDAPNKSVHFDELSRLVKEQKTEVTQLAAIEKYSQDVLDAPKGEVAAKRQSPIKSRVKALVTGLRKLIGEYDASKKKTSIALGFSSAEDREFIKSLASVGKRLIELSKEKAGIE
jgi:hypothetical protein